MEILRGVTFHQKKSAVSLGKFDGIHLGHQLLMNEIIKQEDLVPTVFTFEGMKTEPESLLYSEAEKQYLLEQMGIEREILFPFNDQTKTMSPEHFIQNMLWDSLDARLICVGEDYRFGCKRAGDVAMLERACKKHGCALRVYPKRKDEQGVISSTRIRELIRLGQMQEASKLLGRNFFYLGTVKHGQALGRTIQMPTINILPPPEKVLPPLGVYTSVVTVDGRRFGAVSNLGKKPTVGGKAISLESFLFDFDQNIYGKTVRVDLLEFQRAEQKFDSIEALRAQMEHDKKTAQTNLKGARL